MNHLCCSVKRLRKCRNQLLLVKYIYNIHFFITSIKKGKELNEGIYRSSCAQSLCVFHSMISLADTVVTSCSGISALARMSWALLEPCWMLVRMRVVPPAVVMMLSEEPADSTEATMAPLPEFTPFLF